ncbi:voltage-gated potassium channel [Roseovarius azorensis]|uniref:Voltage-gated potassium channel n=1 Tax=Roseovarius azorensis TaxID=1287727 RepID=A0A1H7VS92_9RHOB|nr:ion transporter [Roseovarius azorensis]SEM12040.1 voltage-gated potassium channel [Roseovarius azorensis]
MLQKKLSQALDPEMHDGPGLSRTNNWIVALICLSILLGVFETEPNLTHGLEPLYAAAHLFFFAAFLIEYLARLYAASLNPRYGSPWRYALTFASLVDLIVLLAFIFPFLGLEATLFRMFRAARLVRLARLGRYSLAMQMISQAIVQRRYELGVSIVAAFGLMLLSSTALYLAERDFQPENFGSIPRAMWWSVATLTTVGYGDIVPVTPLGRIFAAFTAITGIGFIALPTGILAGAFSEALQNIRK